MAKQLIEIEGFNELQAKIKALPDKVKRQEVLKILGQVANPTVAAARSEAPISKKPHVQAGKRTHKVIKPGNLKRSIGKIRGKKGQARVNAVLYVGPRARGSNDGWYGGIVEGGHNVYNKGFKRKSRKSGSSKRYAAKAIGFVKPNPFMERAYSRTKGTVTKDAEVKVAKYIQKQIDRLSK